MSQPSLPEVAWSSQRVPHHVNSSALARHDLRVVLVAAGAPARCVGDAELVLAELIINAVEHGRADVDGMIEVGWRIVGDRVQVRVADAGEAPPLVPRPFDPDAFRGRGLALVETLSERWWTSTEGGTHVAAEVRLSL